MAGFYSFLPYLRQGLNTYLAQPDVTAGSAPEPPLLDLKLHLNVKSVDGTTNADSITKQFALKSPGDVNGVNSNAVVKVSPANWVTNFEPNYLPYIEFYDEDFCWRYTPARYQNPGGLQFRLRPWITLVVLKESEFELFTAPNGKPALRTMVAPSTVFPEQQDLWAWAHVHVNDNIGASDAAIGTTQAAIETAVNKLKNDILDKAPDKAVSRLICPRRLEPITGYTAFVIPTFESGRRTGLGQDPTLAPIPGMLDGGWNANTPSQTEYPIYHTWFFKTGGAGDFESLVRLLQPRVLSQDVGKRLIDLQRSNNAELEMVPAPSPTINLQGVVQPIGSNPDFWNLTDTGNLYVEKVRQLINEPTELLSTAQSGDPLIAPPIYGRWHAAKDRVEEVNGAADWIQEVNLDPRYRLFAGAGVETVRRNQEQYMDIAWAQIGEVMEANRKLRQVQLSKQANLAMYNKHLTPLNSELLINISAPVHQRIRNNPQTQTVYRDVHQSAIPVTMLSGAFRRLTRPGSPLVHGIASSTSTVVTTTALIAGVNNGTVTPAGPYAAPLGMIGYTIWTPSQLTSSFTLSLSSNAGFQFANPGMNTSTPVAGPNATSTQVMVNAISSLHSVIQALPAYSFTVNPALPLNAAKDIILVRTEPYYNAQKLAETIIKKTSAVGDVVTLSDTNFVMAYPKIKIPMFEELAKLSPDWIMPGLNDVEMNSINLLEVNNKYVEAYMLGLNYEMGRELLWRGYPTDQRGTYFSFFWGFSNSLSATQLSLALTNAPGVYNLDSFRDIDDIHRWRTVPGNQNSPLSALGANGVGGGRASMMVMTIRGELLRKYPGTIIYLHKAEWISATEPRRLSTDPQYPPVYPIFTGKLEPDVYLLGFNITPEEARGGGLDNPSEPGYFVVFQERAGELRFGADEASVPIPIPPNVVTLPKWDDLTWAHIKDIPDQDGFINLNRSFSVTDNIDLVTWNWNAATVAYALCQSPVKLNVHAEGLIPEPVT
jgi:hypothetical protein